MGVAATAITLGAVGAGTSILGGYLNGRASAEQARAGYRAAQYNAQAAAMDAAATAANYRMQGAAAAANAEMQAVNYDAQADYYVREAGNIQLQGRDERALRGLQLGQDVGDINAMAAGSGIGVDSRVVQKTIADTRKSAYNDMLMSARNEYEGAYGAMKNAKIAEVNAKNARAIGSWQEGAYAALASQAESYGALSAKGILDTGYETMKAGINNAGTAFGMGVLSGVTSGLQTGLMSANSGFAFKNIKPFS